MIYKYSVLSGLHNEFRKLSGTISTYYTASNAVSRASLGALKRHFGDQFENVRKLELPQEQDPVPPEGGSHPNRGIREELLSTVAEALLRKEQTTLCFSCRAREEQAAAGAVSP